MPKRIYFSVATLSPFFVLAIGCGGDTSPPHRPSIQQRTSSPDEHDKPAAGTTPAEKHERRAPVPLPTQEVVVRVQVWDDTDTNPIHDKCEIWFRGHGSWWLKDATKSGAAAANVGRRKVGQRDKLVLYPDGRDGQEVSIPLTMTSEMNPDGSVRDSIMITIGDDEIEIVGLPIKAATGDTTMKVKRDG